MTKEDFEQKVNFELLGEPLDLIDNFIEYWTETALNGKKMRFQSEKFFNVKRRFKTWKDNHNKWKKPESDKPLLNFIQNYGINNE